MTEAPTQGVRLKDEVTKDIRCPGCGRQIFVYPQVDGYGIPITSKPGRIQIHAGKRFGRQCEQSGELYERK